MTGTRVRPADQAPYQGDQVDLSKERLHDGKRLTYLCRRDQIAVSHRCKRDETEELIASGVDLWMAGEKRGRGEIPDSCIHRGEEHAEDDVDVEGADDHFDADITRRKDPAQHSRDAYGEEQGEKNLYLPHRVLPSRQVGNQGEQEADADDDNGVAHGAPLHARRMEGEQHGGALDHD